ncbi:hypothetical protein JZ751_023273 [Albula glossodonta]|uniref:Uncharacterized protein n=1 Tax=Albula glossodonta TaxID=121402 RepID=A0A8T2PMT0_9TELE|nr:hypothetical protein JZ751_023273 [Albula glossodonta]
MTVGAFGGGEVLDPNVPPPHLPHFEPHTQTTPYLQSASAADGNVTEYGTTDPFTCKERSRRGQQGAGLTFMIYSFGKLMERSLLHGRRERRVPLYGLVPCFTVRREESKQLTSRNHPDNDGPEAISHPRTGTPVTEVLLAILSQRSSADKHIKQLGGGGGEVRLDQSCDSLSIDTQMTRGGVRGRDERQLVFVSLFVEGLRGPGPASSPPHPPSNPQHADRERERLPPTPASVFSLDSFSFPPPNTTCPVVRAMLMLSSIPRGGGRDLNRSESLHHPSGEILGSSNGSWVVVVVGGELVPEQSGFVRHVDSEASESTSGLAFNEKMNQIPPSPPPLPARILKYSSGNCQRRDPIVRDLDKLSPLSLTRLWAVGGVRIFPPLPSTQMSMPLHSSVKAPVECPLLPPPPTPTPPLPFDVEMILSAAPQNTCKLAKVDLYWLMRGEEMKALSQPCTLFTINAVIHLEPSHSFPHVRPYTAVLYLPVTHPPTPRLISSCLCPVTGPIFVWKVHTKREPGAFQCSTQQSCSLVQHPVFLSVLNGTAPFLAFCTGGQVVCPQQPRYTSAVRVTYTGRMEDSELRVYQRKPSEEESERGRERKWGQMEGVIERRSYTGDGAREHIETSGGLNKAVQLLAKPLPHPHLPFPLPIITCIEALTACVQVESGGPAYLNLHSPERERETACVRRRERERGRGRERGTKRKREESERGRREGREREREKELTGMDKASKVMTVRWGGEKGGATWAPRLVRLTEGRLGGGGTFEAGQWKCMGKEAAPVFAWGVEGLKCAFAPFTACERDLAETAGEVAVTAGWMKQEGNGIKTKGRQSDRDRLTGSSQAAAVEPGQGECHSPATRHAHRHLPGHRGHAGDRCRYGLHVVLPRVHLTVSLLSHSVSLCRLLEVTFSIVDIPMNSQWSRAPPATVLWGRLGDVLAFHVSVFASVCGHVAYACALGEIVLISGSSTLYYLDPFQETYIIPTECVDELLSGIDYLPLDLSLSLCPPPPQPAYTVTWLKSPGTDNSDPGVSALTRRSWLKTRLHPPTLTSHKMIYRNCFAVSEDRPGWLCPVEDWMGLILSASTPLSPD